MSFKSKIKFILFGILVVVSILAAILNFSNSNKNKNNNMNGNDYVQNGNFSDIESDKNTIIEEAEVSESDELEAVIWIKNINFLADNKVSYSDIMMLKSKLNDELKTLDKNIYEVNLDEKSFERTETGFKINAKADLLESVIKIELDKYTYSFSFIQE